MQRRLRDPQRASHRLFLFALWVLSPLTVVYACTTVAVRPELVAAFVCVVAASWGTLLAGMLWERLGSRSRGEESVLAHATAMAPAPWPLRRRPIA